MIEESDVEGQLTIFDDEQRMKEIEDKEISSYSIFMPEEIIEDAFNYYREIGFQTDVILPLLLLPILLKKSMLRMIH